MLHSKGEERLVWEDKTAKSCSYYRTQFLQPLKNTELHLQSNSTKT